MAEWCGKPLAETRCALAPGHDGLCCTSTEVSLVAKCESLRSSLRAAEAEWTFVADEHGGHMLSSMGDKWYPEGRDPRTRAAEERAEEAAKETERVRERGLVAVHNVRTQRDAMERERDAAERRAEGLEEALKKAREAGLALLGWIAVCDKQGVVPNRNSVLAQNARAILDPDLARPRSEEEDWSHRCPECHAPVCSHVVLMARRPRSEETPTSPDNANREE